MPLGFVLLKMYFLFYFLLLPSVVFLSHEASLTSKSQRLSRDVKPESIKVIISEPCLQNEQTLSEAKGKEVELDPNSPLVLTHRIRVVPGSSSSSCCQTEFTALAERIERLEREVSELREKCGGADGGCCTHQQSKGPGCTTSQTPTSDCENDCSDQGRCVDGKCLCFPGFSGPSCNLPDCPDSCNDKGKCVNGKCVCDPGFTGPDCSIAQCPGNCNNKGRCVNGKCVCNAGFTGPDCSEKSCPGNCNNKGRCVNGKCVCNAGFSGPDCSERSCPGNCNNKGRCVNGKCVCNAGFEGPDCSEKSCPGNCNSKGRCVNGKCVCNAGFEGPDCSEKSCPGNCNSKGRCVNGKCVCDAGFTGADCSERSCPGNCNNKGRCVNGQCICNAGFTGPDCSEKSCPGNCNNKGRCVNGKCVCETGFTGPDCSERSCPGNCNKKGRCVNGQCICNAGFTGPDCSERSCPENCSNKGRCVNGKCVCDAGFTGPDCSETSCLGNCNNKGRCVNGQCVCDAGFTGPDCSERSCPGNCNNKGRCVNGQCVCDAGFTGPACSIKTCPDNCQNHGRCVNGKCVCDAGFTGSDCSTALCPGNCNNKGRCVNGKCVCDSGFAGPDCSSKSCPNNCSNKGRCVNGQCMCDVGFTGEDCSMKACPNNCNNKGRCVKGRCVCERGFAEPDCSECRSGFTGPDCATELSGVSRLTVNNVTDSSVTLHWTQPAVQYTTYYITFISEKDSDQRVTSTVSGRLNHYTQMGLAAGQRYTVTIVGERDGRRGAESSAKFQTLIAGPKNLEVVKKSTTSVIVQWEQTQSEIDRYLLYFSLNETDGSDKGKQEMRLPPERDSAQIDGLEPGRLYDISLVAEKGGAVSQPTTTQATPGIAMTVPMMTNKVPSGADSSNSGTVKGMPSNTKDFSNNQEPKKLDSKMSQNVRVTLPQPGKSNQKYKPRPGMMRPNNTRGINGGWRPGQSPSSTKPMSRYPAERPRPKIPNMDLGLHHPGNNSTIWSIKGIRNRKPGGHHSNFVPTEAIKNSTESLLQSVNNGSAEDQESVTSTGPTVTTERNLTAYINGTKCVRKVLVGQKIIQVNKPLNGKEFTKNMTVVVGHISEKDLLERILTDSFEDSSKDLGLANKERPAFQTQTVEHLLKRTEGLSYSTETQLKNIEHVYGTTTQSSLYPTLSHNNIGSQPSMVAPTTQYQDSNLLFRDRPTPGTSLKMPSKFLPRPSGGKTIIESSNKSPQPYHRLPNRGTFPRRPMGAFPNKTRPLLRPPQFPKKHLGIRPNPLKITNSTSGRHFIVNQSNPQYGNTKHVQPIIMQQSTNLVTSSVKHYAQINPTSPTIHIESGQGSQDFQDQSGISLKENGKDFNLNQRPNMIRPLENKYNSVQNGSNPSRKKIFVSIRKNGTVNRFSQKPFYEINPKINKDVRNNISEAGLGINKDTMRKATTNITTDQNAHLEPDSKLEISKILQTGVSESDRKADGEGELKHTGKVQVGKTRPNGTKNYFRQPNILRLRNGTLIRLPSKLHSQITPNAAIIHKDTQQPNSSNVGPITSKNRSNASKPVFLTNLEPNNTDITGQTVTTINESHPTVNEDYRNKINRIPLIDSSTARRTLQTKSQDKLRESQNVHFPDKIKDKINKTSILFGEESKDSISYIGVKEITSKGFHVIWVAPEGMFQNFVLNIIKKVVEEVKKADDKSKDEGDPWNGAREETLNVLDSQNIRRNSSEGGGERKFSTLLPGTARSYSVKDLSPQTPYNVSLFGKGPGLYSNIHTFIINTGPEPPTDLSFSKITDSSLSVSWRNPKSSVSGFKVTYTHTQEGEPISVMVDSSSSTLSLTKLSPGSTYEVSVISVLGLDESDSIKDLVKTLPDPPTDLRAINITDTKALLLWRPALATVDQYVIIYSPEEAPGSEVTVKVSGNAVEKQLQALKPATKYIVTILSQLGGQRSKGTQTVFTTTDGGGGKGEGPRDLTASRVTPRTALLSWKAPSSPVTSYKLTYFTEGGERKEVILSADVTEHKLKRLRSSSRYVAQLQGERGGIYTASITTEFTTGALLYPFPTDCSQELLNGITESDVVEIFPEGENGRSFMVYCDMETDGGGWTVFQRRKDGKTDFFRGWQEYRKGFGDLEGEFWLGNDLLHNLTMMTPMSMRVDLRSGDESVYALYSTFSMDRMKKHYTIRISGYSGTAGDAMKYHNGHPFSTHDRDPKPFITRCAMSYKGGWWYKNCHEANLNGLYDTHTNHQGVIWTAWKGTNFSIPFTEMKLRPASFRPRT